MLATYRVWILKTQTGWRDGVSRPPKSCDESLHRNALSGVPQIELIIPQKSNSRCSCGPGSFVRCRNHSRIARTFVDARATAKAAVSEVNKAHNRSMDLATGENLFRRKHQEGTGTRPSLAERPYTEPRRPQFGRTNESLLSVGVHLCHDLELVFDALRFFSGRLFALESAGKSNAAKMAMMAMNRIFPPLSPNWVGLVRSDAQWSGW